VKTPDGYRFSLQWGVDSAEKIQAGEVLEKLGNKKSAFVVLALTEYLKAHPDITPNGQKINIIVQPNLTREQVEAMVISIIGERLSNIRPIPSIRPDVEIAVSLPEQPDLDILIKNLEVFGS